MVAYERVQEGFFFFFVNRSACVRVRYRMSAEFCVKVGLCQECGMLSCLFNICMNGVLKGINARLIGRILNLLMMADFPGLLSLIILKVHLSVIHGWVAHSCWHINPSG